MPRCMSVTYRCNRCGREQVLLHGGSVADLDVLMRSYGWTVKQSGQNTLCPACVVVTVFRG
jgi:predicted RNA-binding Zn-ribbon protein involved in translation (DUF1610 family)